MDAGSLDRRLEWQRATETQGPTGSPVKAWSTLFETWCAKMVPRGMAAVEMGTEENVKEATVTLRFRYRGEAERPIETDRVIFESRTWAVQSIQEVGRREGFDVMLMTRADGLETTG